MAGVTRGACLCSLAGGGGTGGGGAGAVFGFAVSPKLSARHLIISSSRSRLSKPSVEDLNSTAGVVYHRGRARAALQRRTCGRAPLPLPLLRRTNTCHGWYKRQPALLRGRRPELRRMDGRTEMLPSDREAGALTAVDPHLKHERLQTA